MDEIAARKHGSISQSSSESGPEALVMTAGNGDSCDGGTAWMAISYFCHESRVERLAAKDV